MGRLGANAVSVLVFCKIVNYLRVLVHGRCNKGNLRITTELVSVALHKHPHRLEVPVLRRITESCLSVLVVDEAIVGKKRLNSMEITSLSSKHERRPPIWKDRVKLKGHQ
eukprot:XP_001709809.1 Hypothetical protein GL50803_86888 [Giardia lamblia ATCC 50803]